MENNGGIRWKKAFYKWSGVVNPNRQWWQFWKPRKANILLTFHYVNKNGVMKLGDINLEIKHG